MKATKIPALLLAASAVVACSKDNTSSATSDSASATSSTMSSSTGSSNGTSVRGTLKTVSDTALIVASPTGDVTVVVSPPLEVYNRVPATLADVKSNSFVGVTSVAQPDGSQRATEIHIFPDKLRGMGEGSRPMQQRSGGGGGSNTMTNGTVASSQMTNGNANMQQMTNGTISGKAGETLTVQYQGGSQTIQVPPNVSVTRIALTQTKLAPGSNVVVVTTKQPDGTLKASAAMLVGARRSGT